MSGPPVVAVVGPTAAGKSALAVELALALGGEVVSADSAQVYRGMDIGTAKLSIAERRGVPHRLVDVLDVSEPLTVAEFQGWAREAIVDAQQRQTVPIVVGGSALYVRAILDNFEFPGTDLEIRSRLEAEAARVGPESLHARLAAVDPAAAAAILPSNTRRVVRALEVFELTGKPFQARLPGHEYAFDRVVAVGVDVPRPILDERIRHRVDHMWEAGLVEEVRELERQGLREGRTARRALGYRQVLAHLAGEVDEQDAYDDTVRATRRFARRQGSWFRRDPRIHWLAAPAAERLEAALDAVRSVR